MRRLETSPLRCVIRRVGGIQCRLHLPVAQGGQDHDHQGGDPHGRVGELVGLGGRSSATTAAICTAKAVRNFRDEMRWRNDRMGNLLRVVRS